MNQINTETTSTTSCYEFQVPSNIVAIRSNIIQRIKQQQKTRRCRHDSHSTTTNTNMMTKQDYSSALDNGLPSPPIEPCLYEEVKPDMVLDALMQLEIPPSPVMSKASSPGDDEVMMEELASSQVYRKRILLLKQEKHELFQIMKDILSTKKTTTTKEEEESSPIARSRSISHNTTHIRPRYYSNTSSTSKYSYHPYNRPSSQQPLSPSSSSSSSTSSSMSHRVSSSSNHSSSPSYVSSRLPIQQQQQRLPSSHYSRY